MGKVITIKDPQLMRLILENERAKMSRQPQPSKPNRWIEINRYRPVDDNGYVVWFRLFEGDPDGDYSEVEEDVLSTKKDAYAKAKRKYPGVKIVYSTEFSRSGSGR